MDELAAGFLDGDVPAQAGADTEFISILSGELPRIQRIARLLSGDADTADDIVAEAIARSLPRWRAGEIGDCSSYLRRVVVNLAARRWRRRALGLRRDHRALDWTRTAGDLASAAAERDRTLGAVLRLPIRRRAVVVLRFYDDLSERQIAAVLGISVGTVKSQLSRALEQLRADIGTLDGV